MKVGIIDYGMGNLLSVSNALKYLGIDHFISSEPSELGKASHLILPGVGAFEDAIKNIKEKQIDRLLTWAHYANKPVLGICLGMQLLVDFSYENGQHKGLGLIPGVVKRIKHKKVPHMGWNGLEITKKDSPLFNGIEKDDHVYFVHSYAVETEGAYKNVTIDYDCTITAGIEKDNIFGLQFHPEKSGEVGLRILENFTRM